MEFISGLFRFHYQKYRGTVANIQDLMPGYFVVVERTSGGYIYFVGSGGVGDAEAAATQGVAKVGGMVVALMPHAGWEGALQDAHPVVVFQNLTNRLSFPSGLKWVG